MKKVNFTYWIMTAVALAASLFFIFGVPRLVGNTTDTASEEPAKVTPDQSEINQRIDTYLQILASTPNEPPVIKGLGNSFLLKGAELDQAAADTIMSKADYHSGAGDTPSLGLKTSARDFQTAVDYYKRYLTLVPGDQEVMIYLSVAYANLEMTDEAIRVLQEANSLKPDNQRVIYTMGWLLLNVDRSAEAGSWFQHAYDLDPSTDIARQSMDFINSIKESQTAGAAGATGSPDPAAVSE